MRIIQPEKFSSRFELLDQDVPVGVLDIKGRKATATIGEKAYHIRTVGFFRIEVELLDDATEELIATVTNNPQGHPVVFKTGRTFVIKRQGFFKSTYEILAPDNDRLAVIEAQNKWFRAEAKVTLGVNASRYPETTQLVMLGWYMMRMAAAQSAA